MRTKGTTTTLKDPNGSTANFKLCQPPYAMDKAWTDAHTENECGDYKELHQFYLSKGNKCEKVYEDPMITPITLKTAGADDRFDNQGFQLTWSAGADADSSEPYNLRVICDNQAGTEVKDAKVSDKSEVIWNDVVFDSAHTATYTGPEGCMVFDFDVVTGPIIKFMGFIQLVFGAILCFIGRKWIHYSFAALAFIATTGFVFAMAMNMNLVPGLSQGKSGGLIGALCLSCIIGGCGAVLFYKFAKAWATIIAGAICGALIVGVLVAATPISGSAKMIAEVVGFFVSGFIVTKLGKAFVEVGITSIIGAIMFFMGVGSFDPNFPSLTADDLKAQGEAGNPIFFAYIAGMVLLTGAGWFVQLKYTSGAYEDEQDEGNFMSKADM